MRRPATSATVVSLAAAAIIMRSQPNVRYLYASMALLTIPLAALLGWLLSNQRWLYRALVVFLVAATALNAYFLPASNWYHKDFSMRLPFSRSEHERYLREAAPVRDVIAYFNRYHGEAPVLTTGEESEIAGLEGPVYENHWHQWPSVAAMRSAFTPKDMLALMQRWHVQYFIAHQRAPGDLAHPQSLQTLLDICTVPEYEVADRYLAHLVPDCGQRLVTMIPPERPLVTVPPGRTTIWIPASATSANGCTTRASPPLCTTPSPTPTPRRGNQLLLQRHRRHLRLRQGIQPRTGRSKYRWQSGRHDRALLAEDRVADQNALLLLPRRTPPTDHPDLRQGRPGLHQPLRRCRRPVGRITAGPGPRRLKTRMLR